MPVVLSFAVVIGSCTGGPTATTAPPSVLPSVEPSASAPASATTVPTPSPTPEDAAPPELVATWRTQLTGGEQLTLTLGEQSYRIARGPNTGSGNISVRGDRIEFSGSPLCEGTGTYRWALDGDSLTFSMVGTPDPCGGVRVLDGQRYVRLP